MNYSEYYWKYKTLKPQVKILNTSKGMNIGRIEINEYKEERDEVENKTINIDSRSVVKSLDSLMYI